MKVGMTIHEKDVKRYEAKSPLDFKTGQQKRRERRSKARKK